MRLFHDGSPAGGLHWWNGGGAPQCRRCTVGFELHAAIEIVTLYHHGVANVQLTSSLTYALTCSMYSSSQCFLICENFMMGFNAVTSHVSSCSKAWTMLTEGHNIRLGLIHLVVSLMQLLKTGIDEPRQVRMTICEGFPGCHEVLNCR